MIPEVKAIGKEISNISQDIWILGYQDIRALDNMYLNLASFCHLTSDWGHCL